MSRKLSVDQVRLNAIETLVDKDRKMSPDQNNTTPFWVNPETNPSQSIVS